MTSRLTAAEAAAAAAAVADEECLSLIRNDQYDTVRSWSWLEC